MIERITSNDPLNKAIRVVLVFALVFWCSFRLESIAFGDIFVDAGTGHEDGTLTGAVVRNAESDSAIASVSDTASDVKHEFNLSLGSSKDYYIEPLWSDVSTEDDDTLRATFFDWSSNNECVQISQGDDGLMTIKGVSRGDAVVTCQLKKEYANLVTPDFSKEHKGKPFVAQFTVRVIAPTISSLAIVGPDGSNLGSLGSVTITPEQREGYALNALVKMADGVNPGLEWGTFSTADGSLADQAGGVLSDATWNVVADEGTGADISLDGVLTVSGPGTCTVQCAVASEGAPQVTASVAITVEPTADEQDADNPGGSEGAGDSGSDGSPSSGSSDKPEGSEGSSDASPAKRMVLEDIDQGEDHAQTELQVVVNNVRADNEDSTSDTSEGQEPAQGGAEAGEGDQEGKSSSDSADASSTSAHTADESGEGDRVSPQAEGEEETNGSSSDSSSSSSSSASPVGKTYTVDELRELAAGSTSKYTLSGPNGWHTAQGTGPYLDVLLKDAGITDTSQIVSLEFVSYDGTVTAISWDSLMQTRSYFPDAPTGDFTLKENVQPMIAIDSAVFPNYVETDEPASEGASGETAGEGDSAAGQDAPSSENANGNAESGQNAAADGGTTITEQATDSESGGAAEATSSESSGSSELAESGSSAGKSEGKDPAAEPEMVSNTRFRLLMGTLDDLSSDIDPDSLRWINTIRVNLQPETEPETKPDTKLDVRIGYVPMPEGVDAPLVAIPNTEIGSSSFEFYWQYKTSKDSKDWTDVLDASGDKLMVQTLRVPTTEETIGRLYRVTMHADDPDTHERIEVPSDPVEIKVGTGFAVVLAYDPPYPGEMAIFSASVVGADAKDVEFEWWMTTDGFATKRNMDDTATNASEHKSQLYVPTAKQSASTSSGSSDGSSSSASSKSPVITYIWVIAHYNGMEAESPPVLLTVQNTQGASEGTGAGDKEPAENSDKQTGETDGGGQGADSSSQSAASTDPTASDSSSQASAPSDEPPSQPSTPSDTPVSPPIVDAGVADVPDTPAPTTPTTSEPPSTDQPTVQEPSTPTSSESEPEAVARPQTDPNLTPVTIVPDAVNTTRFDPSQVYVSSEVTEQILAQKEEAQATTPGARWTEISAVNPSSQDVRRILADNPFAPYALPLGLGIAVAGGLEKLLAFRRQL